jgi:hypothetical protein
VLDWHLIISRAKKHYIFITDHKYILKNYSLPCASHISNQEVCRFSLNEIYFWARFIFVYVSRSDTQHSNNFVNGGCFTLLWRRLITRKSKGIIKYSWICIYLVLYLQNCMCAVYVLFLRWPIWATLLHGNATVLHFCMEVRVSCVEIEEFRTNVFNYTLDGTHTQLKRHNISKFNVCSI